MVKGTLIVAIDCRSSGQDTVDTHSYQDAEKWYVVKSGPGYCNVWEITEYDNEGLDWLRSIERKG